MNDADRKLFGDDNGGQIVQMPTATPQYHGPLSLLETAIKSGCQADQLEKLISLQERVMEHQAASEYAAAITKFQRLMPRVHKSKRGGKGSYAPFDAIMEIAGPILAQCGIAISFFGPEVEDLTAGAFKIVMRVRVGRHFEDKPFSAPVPDLARITGEQKINEAQAIGGIRSYFKRYCLVDGLNIITTDDDVDAEVTPPRKVSKEQIAELISLVSESGADKGKLLEWAEVKGYEEFTEEKFRQARSMLVRKKREKEEPKPEAVP